MRMDIFLQAWMCGGEVLFVPCSRVGHIYRPYVPGYRAYDPAPGPTAPGTEGTSWGDLVINVLEFIYQYKLDLVITSLSLLYSVMKTRLIMN